MCNVARSVFRLTSNRTHVNFAQIGGGELRTKTRNTQTKAKIKFSWCLTHHNCKMSVVVYRGEINTITLNGIQSKNPNTKVFTMHLKFRIVFAVLFPMTIWIIPLNFISKHMIEHDIQNSNKKSPSHVVVLCLKITVKCNGNPSFFCENPISLFFPSNLIRLLRRIKRIHGFQFP